MTEEELILSKLDMLRKLGELSNAGVKLSQNYNLKSDLKMMKYEYELHKSIRSKQNAINWMSSMSLNVIYGMEMLNEKYNPFDLKLKGWSEQMNADVESYYDVFGELYEKYSHPTKGMAPELKLLLMMSGSALKFHLSNHVINSLPNLNDALERNPELVDKLRSKATTEKIKENTVKQNTALNNKMSKEHEVATQRASDLQMIKEKEMEYLNAQKQLAEKQTQLEQLRRGLQNMTPSEQPRLAPVVVPADLGNILSSKGSAQPAQPAPPAQPYSPQQEQLRQEIQRRQMLEQQMNIMQKNMMDLKRQNDYYENLRAIEKLEKVTSKPVAQFWADAKRDTGDTGSQQSAKSAKSGKSGKSNKSAKSGDTGTTANTANTANTNTKTNPADTGKTNSPQSKPVPINPAVVNIFKTKEESAVEKNKEKERRKKTRNAINLEELSPRSDSRIVSLGTVEEDDATHISLGSKRSGNSKKKATKA